MNAQVNLTRINEVKTSGFWAKCKNISDCAEKIKDADTVTFTFHPYNAEEKEIKKFNKRIKAIASITNHKLTAPKFQVIRGYEVAEMEVIGTK